MGVISLSKNSKSVNKCIVGPVQDSVDKTQREKFLFRIAEQIFEKYVV